jgi:uncharacterized protein (TIGR02145 family)
MNKIKLALALFFVCSLAILGCGGDKGNLPCLDCEEPEPNSYGFVSYGGKKYKTVKIGNQTWFAENLNYAGADNSMGKCYDNEPANCNTYGRLYDWEAAMNVCPDGWHLPSNDDWDELFRYVDYPTAGKHLKATSGWSDDGNGINSHGFSALPGGFGLSNGYFGSAGNDGYWWSATAGTNDASLRYIYYDEDSAGWGQRGKGDLFSVRCLQRP